MSKGIDIPSLSNDELQNELAHARDNKSPQVIAATVAFMVISTVSVALRVLSRRIQGIKLGADDYMIFVSLVSLCNVGWLVPRLSSISRSWHLGCLSTLFTV